MPQSVTDEDGFRPLPTEAEPLRVHHRLNDAIAADQSGRTLREELSHAEQRRVDAELWKANHSQSGRVLRAFRGAMELEGALVMANRKFKAATTPEEAAFWKNQQLTVRAEIRRRAEGGSREPLAGRAPQGQSWGARGTSSGRPRNASRVVTLRLPGRETSLTISQDQDKKNDDQGS